MRQAETIVIGAGAAGLAAARTLSDAGRSVTVLEARPRIGGRIFTVHDREWPLPVELGAEFLHGEAEATRAIARRAGLRVVELPDEHVWVQRGRIRPTGEVWTQLGKALRRIDTRRADVSLQTFLARHKVPGPARALARLFVEGYYAAHVDRISAHSLASGADDMDEPQRQYRLADGYFGVVEWLRAGLDPEHARVRLGCAVEEVRWRRGRVAVTYRSAGAARPKTIEAKRAVVTLPLGVLKAQEGLPGAVHFDPMPRALRAALDGLEVSHVRKVVLRFREAFWDDPQFLRRRAAARGVQPTRVDFLHDRDGDFPTWWAARPWQAPVLTAWAGGPRADALADLDEPTLLDRALGGLSGVLGLPRARLEGQLESWRTHDWRRDPWSRGAYSYVGVGGLPAQRAVARPIEGTLYVAGEATEPDEMGTAAGALASGRRAARQILKSPARSR
jgi:monoamine oxidase